MKLTPQGLHVEYIHVCVRCGPGWYSLIWSDPHSWSHLQYSVLSASRAFSVIIGGHVHNAETAGSIDDHVHDVSRQAKAPEFNALYLSCLYWSI